MKEVYARTESGIGPPGELPRRIGAYGILRQLGLDQLGQILLARHRPSGRLVALKLVKPEWACLPRFASRLAREAFAASQVSHPNIVRILEFGESQRRLFFVLEYLEGSSLAAHVKKQGPLPTREAVSHVLQAARALRHVHAQGLAHGGVEPENLFVDHEGVTRLAGLGLELTPESLEAGERRRKIKPIAIDDQVVEVPIDERAVSDIQGLGRTLAHLLTAGYDTDPTSLISFGVPMNLVELVRSMVDPRTRGGARDVGQVISDLESFLNARGRLVTAPQVEHTRVLSECLTAYRASPSARLRTRLVWGAGALCGVLVFLGLLARLPVVAGTFVGLGLMTAIASFLIKGMTEKTFMFREVRGLIGESRGSDWLIGLAALALCFAALVVLRLQWAWLAFGILALLMASALHLLVDKRIEEERRGAVEEARALLRELRLTGVGEHTLRQFVRATAGEDWEEFFETLFGYEAKLAMRERNATAAWRFLEKRHGRWRDVVVPWIEAVRDARCDQREEAVLQAIEESALVAEGVNLVTARRKSRRIARAMTTIASEIRPTVGAAETAPVGRAEESASVAGAVLQAAETPEDVLVDREHGLVESEPSRVPQLLTGARTRFLMGATLVVGFLLWVHQNGIVSGDQIKDVALRVVEDRDPLGAIRDARIDVRLPPKTRPLIVPILPRFVSGLVEGFNAGAAGLILMISAFIPGARFGYFAIAGAAISLFGPLLGLPALGPLQARLVAAFLGGSVVVLGFVLGRSRTA